MVGKVVPMGQYFFKRETTTSLNNKLFLNPIQIYFCLQKPNKRRFKNKSGASTKLQNLNTPQIAQSTTDPHKQAITHKQGSSGATSGKATYGVIAKILRIRLFHVLEVAEELYLLLTIITVPSTLLEDFLHSDPCQTLMVRLLQSRGW